jgi:type I restriction enzyme M protein
LTRPFDGTRYEALLEGLEIKILSLSEVQTQNRVFRYDSQYFGKAALVAEAQIKKLKWEELQEAASEVESFGAYALTNQFSYVEDGIPFLRCLNIRGGFTSFTDVLYITPEANTLLSKSEVRPGMVLLTMSGSVGNASVALDNWKYPINSNQDVAKITPKAGTNPYYLAAFLGSRYGQIQMERLPVGSVQQHIFLWMIEKLVIARFSPAFENAVAAIVKSAYELDASCVLETENAQQNLLRELGLESWQPPEPLTYTRRASEAFAIQRFDAEHFQPKFQALKQHIEARGECKRLGDLLSFCQRGKQPDYADSGLPVINSKYVRNGTVMMDEENRLARPSEDNLKIHRGDVLINGTGVGTIGRAAAYLHDSPALPDNHVTILRLRKDAGIDPVFLAVQLNSLIGQMQVDQYFKGSSGQIELYPSDIEAFSIWKAPTKTQQTIHQNVDAAHAARREARALLERAKCAVEVAIEESEAAALVLLNTREEF